MLIRWAGWLGVALSIAAVGAPQDTVVKTNSGLLKGVSAGDVRVFKGIPYAAPPTGEWRWQAPRPAAKWTGVRDAANYGPSCPQAPYAASSIYFSEPEPQSEDCLSLNVWAPAGAGAQVPVMVWIHGGAFTRGSGAVASYDGGSLARKGVVVVTINYRLGALGFLAHPELTAESKEHASGNYAILDQIQALRWVQENIRAFGGDPRTVTIFGESAGSWAVNALVASPLAKGLFHRAIGESGAWFVPMRTLREAEEGGTAFAKRVQAGSLAALRALPAEQIVKEQGAVRAETIVDGYTFPEEIRKLFAEGKQNDVPLIAGSNANEMSTLTDPSMVPKTADGYRKMLAFVAPKYKAEIEAVYPAATDAEAGRSYLEALRDFTFSLQMRNWVRASASGKSKAWLYWFSHVPPHRNSQYFGAYHAGEIIYVFDNLGVKPDGPWQDADRAVARDMSGYWVNFAKTGDPNGGGLAEWKAYDRGAEYYLEFGDRPELKQHLLKQKLDAIEGMDILGRR